jgi:hypothetical protein
MVMSGDIGVVTSQGLEGSLPEALDRSSRGVDTDLTGAESRNGCDTEALVGVAANDHDDEQDLRTEITHLQRALQTRPIIDLARGVLMAAFGLSAEGAWTVLVEASQHTNTKLRYVAEELVNAVNGDEMPEPFRQQVAAAVARLQGSPAASSNNEGRAERCLDRGGGSAPEASTGPNGTPHRGARLRRKQLPALQRTRTSALACGVS